jgi:hypothetical protein
MHDMVLDLARLEHKPGRSWQRRRCRECVAVKEPDFNRPSRLARAFVMDQECANQGVFDDIPHRGKRRPEPQRMTEKRHIKILS